MQTTWQWSPAPNLSNEDNDIRSFQRTRSAQYTLEQAQSLLQRTSATDCNLNDDSLTNNTLMELSDIQNHSTSIDNN